MDRNMKVRAQGTHPSHTAEQSRSSKLNPTLRDLTHKTNEVVMRNRETLMGAGKPPVISERPPEYSSQRVSQALADSIFPPQKPHRK